MSQQQHPTPELLAPAGGPEALRAAVAAGADAVYLGLDALNARRSAENFTLATLPDACAFAHLRGVRVYLTANVVILPSEMAEALTLIDGAWAAGIDAVIVQDLGLLSLLRRTLPHVRVHSSTQINAHSSATIGVLAELGVSRVTLAREVSLGEIAGFVEEASVEIESFVHGALCMCYSGQCLMSSLIGRRSANRGMCAQPCRLPYQLVDEKGTTLAAEGEHLLSPADLAGIAQLPDLIETGVAALKIEGRMKSPEYVALVTGVYRNALDRAAARPDDFAPRDGERSVLSEAFSRGFTDAYLRGERGNELMSYRRPNNRGVFIGRVATAAAGRVEIQLESQLDAEDTLELWTSSGRITTPAGVIAFAGAEHTCAPAGSRVTLAIDGAVGAGDRVFRVRNAPLSAAARRLFADPAQCAPLSLDFAVRLREGEAARVTVTDAAGRTGTATGPVVEPARTKAVSAEEVVEHVGRLGGTPYRAAGWDLELSPSVGIGFSTLHRLRREALTAYEAAVLAPWAGRERVHPRVSVSDRTSARSARRETPLLVASVEDPRLADACLAAGADAVHVPTYGLPAGIPPEGVVPLLPRICHDREIPGALARVSAGRPVVAGTLGTLMLARDAGAKAEAHWALNALNAPAVEALAALGARAVWLSPELSSRQIAEVAEATKVPLGVAVYGRQEVMVTEHCILMAEGECDRVCGRCERRAGVRALRDRKGYEFPVRTDVTGRSHLYNSLPLDVAGALPELLAAGVTRFRVDLPVEDARTAAEAVSRARRALDAALRGSSASIPPANTPTTSGHFFRGVH